MRRALPLESGDGRTDLNGRGCARDDSVLTRNQVRDIQQKTRSFREPLFSLYVPTSPAVPGNGPRAWELRVKRAVEATGAPAQLGEAVLARMHEPIHGKTIVFFADGRDVDRIDLAVDLPVLDGGSGEAEAAWGPPMLAPLHDALSSPRYGIVQVDRESVRICESFLGEIAELGVMTRESLYESGGDAEAVRQHSPAYVPARGGSVYDSAERRDETWRQRFYRDVGGALTRWVDTRGIDRVVVMGPTEDTASWMAAVNGGIKERTVGPLGSVPNPRAGSAELLRQIEPALADDQRRQLVALVDEIAEGGIRGPARCGLALENGRLRLIAVAWSLGRDARESLLHTAYQRGTRLVFVTGDVEARLTASCSGVGGLIRGGER